MGFDIKAHRLRQDGKETRFVRTPNQGGKVQPLYLIMHYTAGVSAEGAISWLSRAEAKASAHLVIDRDGTVTQMVTFDRVAWHAGKSRWQDLEGMNSYSIGIELVNAGKLKRVAGKWVSWSGTVIAEADVMEATHKDETAPAGWHTYPQVQIETAIDVAVALNASYRFLDVLGHEDVSPKRKVDSGPAFPMRSFESRVIGRA
ncbi:N-acetylmuramoyl-L-alanine amidase [Ancylobacter aquaticus]|uniref:N-acetylmuramoyl-L-alanine amidase n=1 Tax=Ancylobacter aquaticus TaxID=100 RepID=A0A4R1I1M7_ANCAQ|nr:N-acetylmuramoyl-L-alanine amidase [Ancylobacter aquaticus]TCK28668.1 N-acetylmuramoyl-L-alanine amidase [Ancylobacter aquaticus]